MLERLMSGARIGALELDHEGRVTQIDPLARKIFGIEGAGQVLGLHYSEIKGMNRKRKLQTLLRRIRNAGTIKEAHRKAYAVKDNGHVFFAFPRSEVDGKGANPKRQVTLLVAKGSKTIREPSAVLKRATIDFKKLEKHDGGYIRSHSFAVGALSGALAALLGMKQANVKRSQRAGSTHDIGKVKVPLKILEKKGRLTANERGVMDRHNIEGRDMAGMIFGDTLDGIEAAKAAGLIRRKGQTPVFSHGKKPTLQEVIHVADAVRTMFEQRGYKKAMTVEKIVAELRRNSGKKKQFHPIVAQEAIRLIYSGRQASKKGKRFLTNSH